MKILVFSDSHNHAYRIEQALLNEGSADLIIHLGDCISDIQTIQAKFPQYKYEFVPGNCDFSYNISEEKTIEVEGKKIFLTHSNNYFTQTSLNNLFKATANTGVDVVLYGHTHISNEVTRNGILYLNPGCLSRTKNKASKSYLVLTIEAGKISTKFVNIERFNKMSS